MYLRDIDLSTLSQRCQIHYICIWQVLHFFLHSQTVQEKCLCIHSYNNPYLCNRILQRSSVNLVTLQSNQQLNNGTITRITEM